MLKQEKWYIDIADMARLVGKFRQTSWFVEYFQPQFFFVAGIGGIYDQNYGLSDSGYTAKIAVSLGKIASNQWGLTVYHCVYIYISLSKTGVKNSVSIKKSGQSLHS